MNKRIKRVPETAGIRKAILDIAEDVEVVGGTLKIEEDLDIEEDESVGVLEDDPFNTKLTEALRK